MTQPSLSPDDLPSVQTAQLDISLRRQLEDAISKYFYQSCDGVTQGLLISCEWYVISDARALTLVIECPDMVTHQRI
ncbi:MAG: hypothetical protein VKJ46_14370, partial [Leptolyngbyaceae bacterium]|nr:hypothetical protein [Leptolyngbyaceae bacterium]